MLNEKELYLPSVRDKTRRSTGMSDTFKIRTRKREKKKKRREK